MNENRWLSWALWLRSLGLDNESTTASRAEEGGINEIITPKSADQAVPFPAFCLKVPKRKLEDGKILVVSFQCP